MSILSAIGSLFFEMSAEAARPNHIGDGQQAPDWYVAWVERDRKVVEDWLNSPPPPPEA